MATVDWVYPVTSTISGTTYIKDTDDKIQAAMDDLTLWVNSGTGYLTTGLAQSMVDVTTAQTIAGVKTFTDTAVVNITGDVTGDVTGDITGDVTGSISGATGVFTGQVKGITPVDSEDLARKDYVDSKVLPTVSSLLGATSGTTYTNSTGGAMVVFVNFKRSATSSTTASATVILGGQQICLIQNGSGTLNDTYPYSFIVPDGYTWKVTAVSNMTISSTISRKLTI